MINLDTIRIEQYCHIAAVIPDLFIYPEQINLGNFDAPILTLYLPPAMNNNCHTRQKDQVIWKWIKSLTAYAGQNPATHRLSNCTLIANRNRLLQAIVVNLFDDQFHIFQLASVDNLCRLF